MHGRTAKSDQGSCAASGLGLDPSTCYLINSLVGITSLSTDERVGTEKFDNVSRVTQANGGQSQDFTALRFV